MPIIKLKTLLTLVVAALLTMPGSSLRSFESRNDLAAVPPASSSGWTVPTHGGRTCINPSNCTDSLPDPPASKVLNVIAIGRGVLSYSCVGVDPQRHPDFVWQSTTLWDAAPLIQFLTDEDQLHQLVPQFYDYDYTTLANSTLTCIGQIGIENSNEVVDLDHVEAFNITSAQEIEPPNDPAFNMLWAHSISSNGAWDVYRVETVGGAIPTSCEGQSDTIDVTYAAEYWFYH